MLYYKLTEILGFKNLTHHDIPFVDIIPFTDISLYLDPILIDSSEDSLIKDFSFTIRDYFNCVVSACKANDHKKLSELIKYCSEKNSTHLGMSAVTSNGKGASDQMLKKIFLTLSKVYDKSPHISTLNLLIENFNYDRMSDLLTNILLNGLYRFTSEQQAKYKIPQGKQQKLLGHFWDTNTHSWMPLFQKPFIVDGIEIILVPKSIVRKNLCCTVEKYLWYQYIPQRQNYHQKNNTSLAPIKYNKKKKYYYVGKPSKRVVYNAEITGHNIKKMANVYYNDEKDTLITFINQCISNAKTGKYTMTNIELDHIVESKIRNVS